jgi:Rab3 GTPase-activating protein catalytic subunit
MRIPDNTWVSIWESSKPVPARRQRRLFDDTKEAEKVFHYLANVNADMAGVAGLLFPTFVHCAVAKLRDELLAVKFDLPTASETMDEVVKKLVALSRAPNTDPSQYQVSQQFQPMIAFRTVKPQTTDVTP